jgi:hypothetical protein
VKIEKVPEVLEDLVQVETNKDIITPHNIVDYLNYLLVMDSDMINNLIDNRFICNEQIANNKYIQVLVDNNCFKVGFLGLLNGLLKYGKIYAEIAYIEEVNKKEILSFKYMEEK